MFRSSCFTYMAASDQKEETDVYVRNTAAPIVSNYDLEVCSTCQWIYPQLGIGGKGPVKQVYRSGELTKIMDNHNSQPQKVETFKRQQADEDARMNQPDASDTPASSS